MKFKRSIIIITSCFAIFGCKLLANQEEIDRLSYEELRVMFSTPTLCRTSHCKEAYKKLQAYKKVDSLEETELLDLAKTEPCTAYECQAARELVKSAKISGAQVDHIGTQANTFNYFILYSKLPEKTSNKGKLAYALRYLHKKIQSFTSYPVRHKSGSYYNGVWLILDEKSEKFKLEYLNGVKRSNKLYSNSLYYYIPYKYKFHEYGLEITLEFRHEVNSKKELTKSRYLDYKSKLHNDYLNIIGKQPGLVKTLSQEKNSYAAEVKLQEAEIKKQRAHEETLKRKKAEEKKKLIAKRKRDEARRSYNYHLKESRIKLKREKQANEFSRLNNRAKELGHKGVYSRNNIKADGLVYFLDNLAVTGKHSNFTGYVVQLQEYDTFPVQQIRNNTALLVAYNRPILVKVHSSAKLLTGRPLTRSYDLVYLGIDYYQTVQGNYKQAMSFEMIPRLE